MRTDVIFPGGERQRLTYLRALYKAEHSGQSARNMLYLLDEPTAAVDPLSEVEYAKDMLRSVRGSAAIYITHRLASVRSCDRIVVLDHGSIVEMGSFSELMHNSTGIFRSMYKMQAEKYK